MSVAVISPSGARRPKLTPTQTLLPVRRYCLRLATGVSSHRRGAAWPWRSFILPATESRKREAKLAHLVEPEGVALLWKALWGQGRTLASDFHGRRVWQFHRSVVSRRVEL